MTKAELAELLARRANITKAKAEKVLNLILDQMKDALKRGDRIEVRGFGSFSARTYEPYTGRNPRTGKHIHVPAKTLPFFKAGKDLKERIDYPSDVPPEV